MSETWLPVINYEAFYSISSTGRVRSERRVVKHGDHTRIVPETIMRTPANRDGYPTVRLSRDGVTSTVYVHDLVAAAFLGEKPNGQEVRHIDDLKANCHVSNLAFGTRRENLLDAVRNGRNRNSNKTHCPAGHEYSEANTYIQPATGWRNCRSCRTHRTEAAA